MEVTNVFTTKQVADALSLSSSSIRKYCATMEEAGHVFAKSEQGARILTDIDVQAIERMKKLIGKGAKYPQAAEQAVKAVKVTEIMAPKETQEDRNDAHMHAIIAVMKEMRNEMQELRKEVQELKEVNEAQTLMIEAKAQEEAVKPSIWDRLFRK